MTTETDGLKFTGDIAVDLGAVTRSVYPDMVATLEQMVENATMKDKVTADYIWKQAVSNYRIMEAMVSMMGDDPKRKTATAVSMVDATKEVIGSAVQAVIYTLAKVQPND